MKEYESFLLERGRSMGNPFTLTFGKKPTEYINRNESMEEIISAFSESPSRYQTYLIRGVRGSGKTVLMTSVSQRLEEEGWICVDLNSSTNLIEDFSYRLADAYRSIGNLMERGFDVSIAGFGVGLGGREDRDCVSRCEGILEAISRHGKRVLITIDEVYNNSDMRQFASQFQIWIRKNYPIYLIMTGLHENIYSLQNSPQLTFLLRSPKVTLGPLGISQIIRQYERIFQISMDEACVLARITKGYAFAFQALGMLYWDNRESKDIEEILRDLDDLLDEFVYRKIWDGLSPQDQLILKSIPDEEPIKVGELCKNANITTQVFSKYRERLVDKGLINAAKHGYVELTLPRFGVISRLYS